MQSVVKMTKPIKDDYGFDAWHGPGDRGIAPFGLNKSPQGADDLESNPAGATGQRRRAEPAGPSTVLRRGAGLARSLDFAQVDHCLLRLEETAHCVLVYICHLEDDPETMW